MLSFYRDEDATEDVSSMLPYTLDLSHSDFRYCTHTYFGYFYTVNGKGRPEFQLNRDQFILTWLDDAGRPTVKDAAEGPGASGAPGSSGTPGAGRGVTLRDRAEGLIILATGDPRHPLCLISFVYNDAVRRMQEVRDIAQSLRLKEGGGAN